MAVSPTRPPVRRAVSMPLHDAIRYLSDRVVLTAVFVALFSVNYAANLINAFTNDPALTHSRDVTGAEFLGFVAIAVILKDLKRDRVLRWWDFVGIISITIASFYPSPLCRAIAMTCLGLLFVVRSDKRIASLGQLCIGRNLLNRQTRSYRPARTHRRRCAFDRNARAAGLLKTSLPKRRS